MSDLAGRAWRLAGSDLEIDLKVTHNAKADRLDGLATDADGRRRLVVRIKAPPVEGKANAAVVAFLAQALGCPKRVLEIAAGSRSRLKRIVWQDPPADAMARLEALAGQRANDL